jgi:Zn-dependent protease with chaperone function
MMTHTGLAGDVVFFLLETMLQSVLFFLLVIVAVRLFGIQHPGLRVHLWQLVLVSPVVGPLIFHLLLPRSGARPEMKLLEPWIAAPVAWLETHELLAALILASILVTLFSLDVLRWLVCGMRRTTCHQMAGAASVQAARCAALLPAVGQRLGARTLPSLVMDDPGRAGVYVLRWPRPHICLAKELTERLDNDEVQAILAHEVAHLLRGDWLRLLIAQLCRDLMFYNPIAHLAYARFLQATEEAADDAATASSRERLALASCLMKAQRFSHGALATAPGLGLMHRPAGAAHRAQRLLRTDSPSVCPVAHLRIAKALMALALVLAAVI